jgi:hypothetical protein
LLSPRNNNFRIKKGGAKIRPPGIKAMSFSLSIEKTLFCINGVDFEPDWAEHA